MRKLLCLLAMLALLLAMPSGNIASLDRPWGDPGGDDLGDDGLTGGGDDDDPGGEDHPWGGDKSPGIDPNPDIIIIPARTGISALDAVIFIGWFEVYFDIYIISTQVIDKKELKPGTNTPTGSTGRMVK